MTLSTMYGDSNSNHITSKLAHTNLTVSAYFVWQYCSLWWWKSETTEGFQKLRNIFYPHL